MLARRKPMRSGIARGPRRTFHQHRQWVRGHVCAVPGCQEREIEAAHYDGPVPYEERGGKALKDHDKWTLPLCRWIHHPEYHSLGWARFDQKHGINTRKIAEELARRSPHRWRWEEQG